MESQNAPSDAENLQFDRAEPTEEERGEATCQTCERPIENKYFEVDGKVLCASCKEGLLTEGGAGRLLRATLYGVPAAMLGAGIYYAIRALTGYEIGLVAIVIGLIVGGAVRAGSDRRGGWVYQSLAVALTYFSIVSTYIPLILEGLGDEDVAIEAPAQGLPAGEAESEQASAKSADVADEEEFDILDMMLFLVIMFTLACAAPFLAGFDNAIGIIIIAFGLHQAWKLNKQQETEITGPFALRSVHQ